MFFFVYIKFVCVGSRVDSSSFISPSQGLAEQGIADHTVFQFAKKYFVSDSNITVRVNLPPQFVACIVRNSLTLFPQKDDPVARVWAGGIATTLAPFAWTAARGLAFLGMET